MSKPRHPEPPHTITDYKHSSTDRHELQMRFVFHGQNVRIRCQIGHLRTREEGIAYLMEQKQVRMDMMRGKHVAGDDTPITTTVAKAVIAEIRDKYERLARRPSLVDYVPSESVMQLHGIVSGICARYAADDDSMLFNYVNVYGRPAAMFTL